MDLKEVRKLIFKDDASKVIGLIVLGAVIYHYIYTRVLASQDYIIQTSEKNVIDEVKKEISTIKTSFTTEIRPLKDSLKQINEGQRVIATQVKAHILKSTNDKEEIIKTIEIFAPFINLNNIQRASNTITYARQQ